MKLNPDGSLQPHLAQSVSHRYPLVYVYTLRKGVKFWDGNELTAEDVANAINYNRDRQSLTAGLFGPSIRDVKATARYTVQVTLKQRDASVPYVFASALATGIFEKKFADAHKGTMGLPGVLTMGTGPWKFDSLDPTRGIELSANPNYWQGRVPFQRISIKFFANETGVAFALRSGEIDITPQVSDAQGFASTSGVSVGYGASCWQLFFSMNTKVAPWNDIHVRRAVAYAVNRADFVKASGKPRNIATSTLIPPAQLRTLGSNAQVSALLKSLPQYPHNLAKARQEMAQSAHPRGFSVTLPTYPLYGIPTLSEVLAGQLKQIGIDAQVAPPNLSGWVAQILTPDKRPPTLIELSCASPDPSWFPNLVLRTVNLAQGKFNVANYGPPAVDELVKQGLRTTDKAKRLAVYGQLLRRVAVDVPYIPIYIDARTFASTEFAWPTYNGTWTSRPWALELKAK